SGANHTFEGRKKKLILAFHFQYANQAAWNCETCRRDGLERTRRCAWIKNPQPEPPKVVWARRGALSERCPRSVITAESLAWIEEFEIWRIARTPSLLELDARKADA